MHLIGDPASPRIVTVRTGVDHTKGMKKWAEDKLRRLEKEDLCGFIFKSKSPSSGISGIKVYTSSGMPSNKGTGIFGGAFMRYFPLIPVIDDRRLHNPDLRENFIEQVLVYKRWKEFLKNSIEGDRMQKPIKLYTLSTCVHCKATKKLLNECAIQYEFTDVDLLPDEERIAVLEDVRKFNPECSFPTIIIGDEVIIGFEETEIRRAIGL